MTEQGPFGAAGRQQGRIGREWDRVEGSGQLARLSWDQGRLG